MENKNSNHYLYWFQFNYPIVTTHSLEDLEYPLNLSQGKSLITFTTVLRFWNHGDPVHGNSSL
jgi:hypothetical protein